MNETFNVSFLNDTGERNWLLDAEDPDGALHQAMQLSDSAAGVYSVWDLNDLWGTPLVEHEIPG